MFPQLGHPVLTESRVDLPQVQIWVVALSPATELTDLKAVTVLRRLAAGVTALTDEPLELDWLNSFLTLEEQDRLLAWYLRVSL